MTNNYYTQDLQFLPVKFLTPERDHDETTETESEELIAEPEEEDGVQNVTIGIMTTAIDTLPWSSTNGCHRAMNTSYRPHSIDRPVGTPTNNAAKRKIRRAQKALEDVQVIIDADRRTKVKEWRSSLTKYRNKMLQLVRNSEDKNKLVGYVFSSRMASQKDVESAAIYVRSLKEKVNHQCQQNENMRNNIMRSRPRHL